ncbi:MAG: hypothetical protein HOO06_07695 [Bdellovibrionaceae bacterium]|jgi:hypothetical protein|nr:hypothetical protein [Pseudobdellovibrionaceae bacterium]
MEKKKQGYRLGKIDWTLLVFSMLGIIASSYLLFNESILLRSFMRNSTNSVLIGKIKIIKNDVRRKVGASLLWFKATNSEDLFEGDSLFTGDKSATKFILDSGLELTLQANSLVKLTRSDNEVFLDLQVGQFSAKVSRKGKNKAIRKDGLNIVHKGKVAKIELNNEAIIKISKKQNGGMGFVSKEGAAKFELNGEVQVIDKTNFIEIKENLKVKKTQIKISLKSPKDDQQVWLKPGEVVPFHWETAGSNKHKYQIKIAKDINFNEELVTREVSEQKFSISDLDSESSFFWKVLSKDELGKKLESPVFRFETVSTQPLAVYFPMNRFEFELEEGVDSLAFKMFWENRGENLNYHLQVADNIKFKNPQVDIETVNSEFHSKGVSSGEYFWRVSAKNPTDSNVNIAWSQPFSFKVIQSTDIQLLPESKLAEVPKAPEVVDSVETELQSKALKQDDVAIHQLKSPSSIKVKGNQKIYKLIFDSSKALGRGIAAHQKRITNKPQFSWQDQQEKDVLGLSYELQMSKQKLFNKINFSKTVTSKNFDWGKPVVGKNYWRVRALAKNRRPSRWSSAKVLDVQLSDPKITDNSIALQTKKLSEFNKKGLVKLTWKGSPFASKYILNIYDKDDQLIKTAKVKKTSYEAELDHKSKYSYNIQMLGENNRKISSISNKAQIVINKSLMLDPPKLKIPSNGMEVVSFEDEDDKVEEAGASLFFKWTKNLNANEYIIQISKDKSFSVIEHSATVKESVYLLEEKIKGKLYWRVRSKYKEFESAWSKPRWFAL